MLIKPAYMNVRNLSGAFVDFAKDNVEAAQKLIGAFSSKLGSDYKRILAEVLAADPQKTTSDDWMTETSNARIIAEAVAMPFREKDIGKYLAEALV